jgi:hypothetical protein
VRKLLCLLFVLGVSSPVLAQDVVEPEEDVIAASDTPGLGDAEPAGAETEVEDAESPADGSEVVDESEAVVEPEPNLEPVLETVDPGEVFSAWTSFVNALKSGNFPLIAGAFIFLLLAILKLPVTGAVLTKVPSRYRVLIVIGLAGLMSVFDAVVLGTTWGDAFWAMLHTAPIAVFSNELFLETLVGKRYAAKE